MSVSQVLGEVEAAGIAFRLDGERVRIWFPEPWQREDLARQVAFLRAHRLEVTTFLRARATIPAMPPGVRLIAWKLKEPPVSIETCAVITDSALFVRTTLGQLRRALAQPKRWVGWSVPQLIDRLAQVGVIVALESKGEKLSDGNGRRCGGQSWHC
jgi:hypothetical protein